MLMYQTVHVECMSKSKCMQFIIAADLPYFWFGATNVVNSHYFVMKLWIMVDF